MFALTDKIALITGASSGIGAAAARLFAQQGAKLILAARREERLQQLCDEIRADGGEAVFLAGDVRREDYAEALVALAREHYGRLDIAFNNAGILDSPQASHEVSLAQWQNTLDINLTGAFLCAKHQLPLMQATGGGSIIFTSSFIGHTASMPQMSAYAVSKAGLIGLAQTLAMEYAADNIRVNALLPGGTVSEMSDAFIDSDETRQFLENMHPLKRLADADEIARSALYLASDLSSFTTGSALIADGGVSVSPV